MTQILRIIKKWMPVVLVIVITSWNLSAMELGFVTGSLSKPTRTQIGVSGSMGMVIPMVKIEMEWHRKSAKENDLEFRNSLSIALKVRPKFGNLAPYAAVGVGSEFDHFNFHFTRDQEKFSFFGGGLHYFFSGMFSIRGDVRFLHYSAGYNRTRISAGVFLHI